MAGTTKRKKDNTKPFTSQTVEDLGSSNFQLSHHRAVGVRQLRSNSGLASQAAKAPSTARIPSQITARTALEDTPKDNLVPLASRRGLRKTKPEDCAAPQASAKPAESRLVYFASNTVQSTGNHETQAPCDYGAKAVSDSEYPAVNKGNMNCTTLIADSDYDDKNGNLNDQKVVLSHNETTDTQSLTDVFSITPGMAAITLDDGHQPPSFWTSTSIEQKFTSNKINQQPDTLEQQHNQEASQYPLLEDLSQASLSCVTATPFVPVYPITGDSDVCDSSKEQCDIHQTLCKHPELSKLTSLAYLAGEVGWSLVLTNAGNRFMRNTLLFNAFPDRNVDLPEAALALAIARDTVIKRGYHLNQRLSLNRDMAILVFQQHVSLKIAMKIVGRRIVKAYYASVINVQNPGEIENQEGEYIEIQSAVDNILFQGKFLWGPPDSQTGMRKNLSHPAIEALILEFVYRKGDGMAEMYPKDFESEIPNHTVALVTTCLQNCLEEYLSGCFANKCFAGIHYRNTFGAHLRFITDLEKDPLYGLEFKAQKRNWASKGVAKLKINASHPALYVPSLARSE